MKNKHFLFVFFAFFTALSTSVAAQNTDELFTGDKKDACEALLCLSSGQRPDECRPSLDRYFGIKKKKMSDTIEARHDFLKKCPASEDSQEMKALTSAIAQGAGRCDADYLNTTLRRQIKVYACSTTAFSNKKMTQTVTYHEKKPAYGNCQQQTISVIDSKQPAYCVTYQNHAYTYEIGVKYVGDPYNGGHWE
jgi:hypothetical protein